MSPPYDLANVTSSVIDGATNAVTATIPVGFGSEHAGIEPVTDRSFVANSGSTTVSVIKGWPVRG